MCYVLLHLLVELRCCSSCQCVLYHCTSSNARLRPGDNPCQVLLLCTSRRCCHCEEQVYPIESGMYWTRIPFGNLSEQNWKSYNCCVVLVIIPVQKNVSITAQTNYTNLCPCQRNPSQTTWRSGHILAQKIG